ncbi:AMP-binding protein [Antrihabitans sp. YC2-6]|uniref:AMP-binding protein n=1 Tax=Antrihabitans sp. YC2-6 TaxID=2799498 RepID=UPI0018F5616B|nr:AMP-binding protein [Antrihabitans sp. YC2-6]MBJ8345388.1 AMP-binding protein [Antrihabitans sp. YC2-6]
MTIDAHVARLRNWLIDPTPGHGIHLADEADGWQFYSYADLADRARRIATLLRDHGFESGDNTCVVMPTTANCIATFFGAFAAGGEFTPIPPPMFEDLTKYCEHLSAILTVAEPRIVVTSPEFVELVTRSMTACGRTDAPLVIDHPTLAAVEPIPDLVEPGAVCLLQFTSGSTGSPRGVQISWGNLADNALRIADIVGWRDGDATASWLPLYHDMGLIGALFMTVTMQGDLYLMRPDQFVRDPLRWLRAMEHAQHSPSPAFTLKYVARRVDPDQLKDLDFSGWRSLALGSEPVPPGDALEFANLLAPSGFDISALTIAYGLAENTLHVTSSARNAPITALRIDFDALRFGEPVEVRDSCELTAGQTISGSGWTIGLGRSTATSAVAIVDENGGPLPDGTLGEVVVTGESVALGYQGESATAGTRIVDGTLLSGDAGFLHDGELYVIGRMGTSLKVRGRSVFMEDIETRVATEISIAPGKVAAVAVPDGPEPGVALFVERDAGPWVDAARRSVAAAVGSINAVRVITGPRGLIQRTSSGKPRRRHMWQLLRAGNLQGAVDHAPRPSLILSEDYIQTIFGEAARQISIAANSAVLLEGSIAEGFGNDGSDIDFLIVSAGADRLPTMPTVLFVDGRRVEVRTRSEAQLREQIARVGAGSADEDTLNRVQRFLRAHVVRTPDGCPDIEALRALLPYDAFAAHMQEWWSARAVQALRYAVALSALGAGDEADGWANDASNQAMKSWVAGRGEAYLESKWLPQQLARIGADPLVERFRASTAPTLDDAIELAALAGVPRVDNDADSVRLQRVPDVTTWPIGDRIHVVRDRRDVFALSENAGKAWRCVVFGQSLADVIDRAEDDIRAELAEFVRLGLVGLRWERGESIEPALAMCDVVRPFTPPPGHIVPPLGVGGATRTPGVIATLSPLPAHRFTECALTLIWSNIVLENAREDLIGAVKNSQWQVAAIAAHRLVAMCTRVLLSTYGVHPLPADVAAKTTLQQVVPAIAEQHADIVTLLDTAQDAAFDDAHSAQQALAALTEFVDAVRKVANGSDFPTSFTSREQWRRTLDISYDWLRVGGYLDSKLPLDEARDLLTSGGLQPHARPDIGDRE